MNAVVVRIIARYLSGALVSYGIIPHEAAAELAMDPDVALVLGALVGGITEIAYAYAKKWGWTT